MGAKKCKAFREKNVQTSAQTRTSVRPYADYERGPDCADLGGGAGGGFGGRSHNCPES